MSKKIGIVFMTIGVMLILSALSLILYNKYEDRQAALAVDKLMPELQNIISDNEILHKKDDAISYEMTVSEIDGYGYIGYLSIPVLGLELPIMSEWDYNRLKIAPCRQFGTVQGNDFVIAGHNYSRHFGRLSSLEIGDLVKFTDMDGKYYNYEVSAIETLMPKEIDKMKNSQWDLSLYTCTYGGASRITVRCKKMENY